MKRILLIPPRVVAWLSANNARPLKIILMTLVLITALYSKEYRGEHQQVINNNIGGILYVIFGSLLISVLFPHMPFYWVVIWSYGLTCVLEFLQYFQLPFMAALTRYKSLEYLFGTSYSPVDFIYYGIGALLSLALLFLLEHKE